MGAVALNQVGHESMEVTGVPTQIPLPTYTDYTDAPNGVTRNKTTRHAIIQCYDNPVRWASGQESVPSGSFGTLLNPGETLDFTDSLRDFWGILKNMKFVLDASATGNANLDIAYFA